MRFGRPPPNFPVKYLAAAKTGREWFPRRRTAGSILAVGEILEGTPPITFLPELPTCSSNCVTTNNTVRLVVTTVRLLPIAKGDNIR